MRLTKILFILFFISSLSYSQDRELSSYRIFNFTSNNGSMPYRMLNPYSKTDAKIPLFVFLHGSGERGSENQRQLIHGSKFFLRETEKKEFNCYVLVPQCAKNHRWSYHKQDPWINEGDGKEKKVSHYGNLVIELIESLIKEKNIDRDRVYISGLSMGGYGTFDLVSHRPDLFAAAAPICGGADLELLNNAVGVPFWIFHGDSDKVVPVQKSRNAFKFLIKERDHHKYTEYKGVYHNSWNNVFEEEDYFKWLFSKSR